MSVLRGTTIFLYVKCPLYCFSRRGQHLVTVELTMNTHLPTKPACSSVQNGTTNYSYCSWKLLLLPNCDQWTLWQLMPSYNTPLPVKHQLFYKLHDAHLLHQQVTRRKEDVGSMRLSFYVASYFSELQIEWLGKSCHSSQLTSMTKLALDRYAYFLQINDCLIIACVQL